MKIDGVILAYNKVFKCIRSAETLDQLETCRKLFENFKKMYNSQGVCIGFLETHIKLRGEDLRARKVYFISGHRDISADEFEEHYAPKILAGIDECAQFVVGDYQGVDIMAQQYLAYQSYPLVEVFHMFTSPRNHVGIYPTNGGWKSDIDRDWAMTLASDADIAWIRDGKGNSGTAQNVWRRALKNEGMTSLDDVITREQGMFN